MAQRERGGAGGQVAALRSRLHPLVEPAVHAAGLDLEELAVSRAGRRYLIRVTVDGDGGVGHDELSNVSRDISAALDEADEVGGDGFAEPYTLEVSSPGVDRPLTLPRHWRRNVGRLVKVSVGSRTHTGRVLEVDDAGVLLEGLPAAVTFAELGPGRVQVEFHRLAELADEEIGETLDEGDQDGADTEEEDEA